MNKSKNLETINTAEENILQLQLLQVLPGLSAAPSKMTQDEIVTSNVVYESAHGILSKGMSEVSARVLIFLRSSLRAAASGPVRECTARARARELLRCSGCLQDMLQMFLTTKTMLRAALEFETTKLPFPDAPDSPETQLRCHRAQRCVIWELLRPDGLLQSKENWKVICECLAESCRDCPDNQRYCSSLIPICIQRRDEMNNEILNLLYCLLLNNTTNINLFVECNGTSIFTKDTIHDSSRMELLSVVVENASAANVLKRDSDLLNSLITVGEDYKVNCQGSWKMVEWASVILFHLATHIEGVDNSIGTTINRSDFDLEMSISETTLNNLSVSFLLKPNWEKVKSSKLFKNATTQDKIKDHDSQCSTKAIKGFSFKALSDEPISFRSSTKEFSPKFVSTPKKRITTTHGMQVAELSKELINRTEQKSNDVTQRKPCGNNSASIIKKTLSTSARLLSIVNNSCVSIYHTIGTIFCHKAEDTNSRSLLKQKYKIDEGTMNKFTKYLKQRVAHPDTKARDNLNVQKQDKRKLAIKRKFRKSIVKKLKTGIHFYGCNFKKIAQAMWSQEKEITPKVLYNIYRKYILK
ncbi:uncharacterized protein LOC134753774 [Cydia strobilella]|uniref:uncharacterized protein LOC134753774 n=1 Tax=Cydia strobilella TaxID=1100964 RepID=UPI0030040F34